MAAAATAAMVDNENDVLVATRQLLDNESASAKVPLEFSIDVAHSCCIVAIIAWTTDPITLDVYHISIAHPYSTSALWNSAAARPCRVWILGGNVIPTWRRDRSMDEDRPFDEVEQLEELAATYRCLTEAIGDSAAVDRACQRLDTFLQHLGVATWNTVLPILFQALLSNEEARMAMKRGTLKLVNTALTIPIRSTEASAPKFLLGGADRLATIVHNDGTIEVSFGYMRESGPESKAFSKSFQQLMMATEAALNLNVPFPLMSGTDYELGKVIVRDDVPHLTPRECPLRRYPRTLNPWRQFRLGTHETLSAYRSLGLCMHQWNPQSGTVATLALTR